MQTKKIAIIIAGVFFISHLSCKVPNFAGRLELTFAGNCLNDLGKLSNWNTLVDIYLKRGKDKWIEEIPLTPFFLVPIKLACEVFSRMKSRSNPDGETMAFYAKKLTAQRKKIEELNHKIQAMVNYENQKNQPT